MTQLHVDPSHLSASVLTPPISKSDAQRALVLAHLTGAWPLPMLQQEPEHYLAADVHVLRRGIEALRQPAGPVRDVNCADGGAPFRILVTQSAVTPGANMRLTGTPRLGERPHGPLFESLRQTLGPSPARFARAAERDLAPLLLSLALLLALADLVIGYALRGLLPRFRRSAATAAVVLVTALAAAAGPAAAGETDEGRLTELANETRLAYVLTGDAAVDQESEAGLKGLRVGGAMVSVMGAGPSWSDTEKEVVIVRQPTRTCRQAPTGNSLQSIYCADRLLVRTNGGDA